MTPDYFLLGFSVVAGAVSAGVLIAALFFAAVYLRNFIMRYQQAGRLDEVTPGEGYARRRAAWALRNFYPLYF